MELWIPIAIAAAFSQNLRNALQKSLKGRLSTWGATASRFVYAAPLAVLLFIVMTGGTGRGARRALSFRMVCSVGSRRSSPRVC